jgi:hypothetical protein
LACIACERAMRSPALLGMLTLMVHFLRFRKRMQAFLTKEYGRNGKIFQKIFNFLGFMDFPGVSRMSFGVPRMNVGVSKVILGAS